VIEVKVPVLAESIAEATLLEWKKQPGEAIEKDELLIEIETDKVVLEVLAPQNGVMSEIIQGDGATVASAELIARIDPGATPPAVAEPGVEQTSSAAIDLSPGARKLATEHDVDASAVTGSGRGGRITKEDVQSHIDAATKTPPASPAPPAPPAPLATPTPAKPGERPERREPMSRLRQRVAERLVQAQTDAAILTTFNELNMGPMMALRSRYKEQFEKVHGARLGFMSFFAKAAIVALKRFPAVNAYIEGTEIVYHDYYDIGIAVGSPRGLVVPILRDVDQMSFAGIETGIADFGARAQSGGLRLDELTGGTFTISNGGVFGSMLSTPILNPPQSGILGMHKTTDRPVVENGEIVIRPIMYLALSYDHRIVDGREAVQFLVTIKEALEDPGRMLLEV
jgi:2-oxoglutarate dehydrogenase E2 component (dihydrolipoamide succinyltransferase)